MSRTIYELFFVIGGILFSVNEERKQCMAEIGHKRIKNNLKFKEMNLPNEVYFGDKITEEYFLRLNSLRMLRKVKIEELSQGFLDYVSFSKSFEHHNKLMMFESKNNGVVFIYTVLNVDTRKVDTFGYIIRGVSERNFSLYYRGGIDKTMWFYHKKTTQKMVKKIRKSSYRKSDLYEELDMLKLEEIERLLPHVDDEKIYERIVDYIERKFTIKEYIDA